MGKPKQDENDNKKIPTTDSKGIKKDRLKKSTIQYKKRKGFGGAKIVNKGIVNSVNIALEPLLQLSQQLKMKL